VQYICGATEFYNCSIQVGPGVLVPRPETERLVEIAVEQYDGCGAILDLCTGSGAILFALAKTLADPPAMTGTDLSTAALRWAGRNQEALGLDRIEFLQGDLYEPVHDRTFGLIIANPPYVSPEEYERLGEDIRNYEPREALVANDDGQAVLHRIAESATAHLVDDGVLICEIGETQSQRTIELFAAHGLRNPQVFQDYNDRDRVVVGRAWRRAG
jgi:release factor glutamine methyltransferase